MADSRGKGSKEDKPTNVQVAVRVRPTNDAERAAGQPTIVTSDTASKQITVSHGPSGKKITKSYNFDKVVLSFIELSGNPPSQQFIATL